MTEERSHLLKQSAGYVSSMLSGVTAPYTFHTLEHTKYVVSAAGIIGRASKLSAQQLDTVLIAAWFHDVGYADGAKGHEERSSSIAMKMLTTWGADVKMVTDVSRAILATRHPQHPADLPGKVLCDADHSYLASAQYELHLFNRNKEFDATLGITLNDQRLWHQRNIDFLISHRYFTDYGNDILGRRKKINLTKMLRHLHATPVPLFINPFKG